MFNMDEMILIMRKIKAGLLVSVVLGISNFTHAGVALGATRVIYPEGQKQVTLAVNNNDDKSTFLIQSWIENNDGKKDPRFLITPPLFAMKGKKENTLRIVDATNQSLPKDRESLFWVNVKAIPSLDKSQTNANVLQFAIINRIKLFYRPKGLALPPEQAPAKLSFKRVGATLKLSNPTPYYLTVTELKAGPHALESTMVPPMNSVSIKTPANMANAVTYRTINDYGALTPLINVIVQ